MCQILTRISPFGMAALYEHVRLFRSPCSGGITIKRGLRIFLPVIQNLVKYVQLSSTASERVNKVGSPAKLSSSKRTKHHPSPVHSGHNCNPSPLSPYKTPNPALSWRYAARYPHRAGYGESVLHPDRTLPSS